MDTEKPKGVTAVRVPDPKACIGDLLGWLRDFRTGQAEFENRNGGRVGDGASIPSSCKIEPGAVIWPGVVLGEDCRVGANAVLYDGVRAGDRCRFFSTCVVGADGFGYSFRDPSNPQQLAHLGGVEIGDDVDIGGGTVVVAGTIDPTQIGAASKIDALVLVAHNVEIGRSVMVCGGAVIGGLHQGERLGFSGGGYPPEISDRRTSSNWAWRSGYETGWVERDRNGRPCL